LVKNNLDRYNVYRSEEDKMVRVLALNLILSRLLIGRINGGIVLIMTQ
jgi:hypothetical protein